MKKFLLALAVCFSLFQSSYSQCSETPEPKVLLVGDSWAFFMSVDQTINNAFRKWGFSDYRYLTNSVIAENGAETDDFLTPAKQNMIDSLLNANPSIEVVHLSIGGNDVLGDWKVSFSQGKTDSLKQQVSDRLLQVINFIKSARPGIKILWGGYMYPNFGEVIPTSFLGSNHPFNGTWQKMEYPTFSQLNNLLIDFSEDVETYANTDPDVDFINVPGLMQYTFGQADSLKVAPGGSYPAFTQPLPYGDPNYPSPQNSMRDYLGITKDCFHLSAKGYADMLEYHIQKYYHKLLMDDLYLLSDSASTGSVTSTGNVADSLVIGEASGESFSTVLSFDTRAMADTTLTRASIFLRRKALEGTNPISGNLDIRIKNGTFGVTASVEAVDYSSAGDGAGNPCLFGSNGGNGHWIRLDIPVSLFPHISKNDITQFVVSAPNHTGGKASFNGTEDPEFAPVLNLNYGPTPSAITDNFYNNNISAYPNPVSDVLTVEVAGAQVNDAQVFSLSGNLILQTTGTDKIDVSALPQGIYLLQVTTNNGIGRQRFVKQ